jgi:hypothetical protein
MAGNYAVGAKNAILTYIGTQITKISVHTADPGSTGASEATGGSPAYAKLTPTWGSPTGGAMACGALNFNLPAGTYTHLGLWAGTTYWGKITLPSSVTYTTQDVLPLLSVTLDQNAVASA